MIGSTFAPLAAALNKEIKRPRSYVAACVSPIGMFKKDDLAPTTFGILARPIPSALPGPSLSPPSLN